MHIAHSKPFLMAEAFILVLGIPALLYAVVPVKFLLPAIWVSALYCYVITHRVLHMRILDGWGRAAVTRQNLKPILRRFAINATLLLLVTWWCAPQLLFQFPKQNPLFWLVIMVLYPLLSVVPQEIIFRSFFFARYPTLFTRSRMMILASAVSFGLAHFLFHNWIAPALCLIGGFLFATTYAKYRSLMLVSLEHALYGDFIFTVGLGRYFYHGAVAAALH